MATSSGEGPAPAAASGSSQGGCEAGAGGGVPAIFCGDAIHSPLQVLAPPCQTARCIDP